VEGNELYDGKITPLKKEKKRYLGGEPGTENEGSIPGKGGRLF